MRRTWIGTVAAAALATAAATGYAAAQEKQPGQQGASTQQMEKGQHAQSNERMGQQRSEKPGMENKAAQGQRPGEERMNKAQNERPKTNAETGQAEKTQGAQNEKQGAQNEKMQGEKGAQNEKMGAQNEKQGAQNEKMQGEKGAQREKTQGAEQTGQTKERAQTEKGATGTQRNETAQGERGRVNPDRVRVTGKTRITNDKAARLSETLLASGRSENVNVALNVGVALPGTVNLMPLPANVVDIVPEFRGYDYVVVNDEIAIVQPSSRQVVDVINTGGATAMAGGTQAMAGTRLNPCGTP